MNINTLKAAQQGAQQTNRTAGDIGRQTQSVNQDNQHVSETSDKNGKVRGERKIEQEKAAFQSAQRDAALEIAHAQQQNLVSGLQSAATSALGFVNRFLS